MTVETGQTPMMMIPAASSGAAGDPQNHHNVVPVSNPCLHCRGHRQMVDQDGFPSGILAQPLAPEAESLTILSILGVYLEAVGHAEVDYQIVPGPNPSGHSEEDQLET
ncbi:hypothetical protein M378DRAFT_162786 [Amanita muscaria Koide BX008]|uniref:Uncharacterized protein n=1 Tax=Amanita muscaria (strain Koide BX008) TaxID=946122 RepID=A0A0C2X6L1_AMAMK|nr:hypothetical protein M378DRAFT_162786 [Amanita muscaria Koide BX008]